MRIVVKTNERILEQALVLFNAHGVGRTSLNRIASELGISSGNLHYHFKTRGHLIARLINRFDCEVSPLVGRNTSRIDGIDDFWLYLHLLFEVCLRHRFILRDIDQILSECGDALPRLVRIRASIEERMLDCCRQMHHNRILIIGQAEIQSLALHLAFVVCCWPTFDMLASTDTADSGPTTAAYQALTLLAPFLAPGQRTYLDYLRNKYLRPQATIAEASA